MPSGIMAVATASTSIKKTPPVEAIFLALWKREAVRTKELEL
jgi:hypothetical protein